MLFQNHLRHTYTEEVDEGDEEMVCEGTSSGTGLRLMPFGQGKFPEEKIMSQPIISLLVGLVIKGSCWFRDISQDYWTGSS